MITKYSLDNINKLCKATLIQQLGIEFTEISEGKIVATMPVDERTIQPMKRLHGGASMALAESVGSVGSLVLVNSKEFNVLGVEISGSHIGSTNENEVYGIGKIIHQGTTTHIWEIRIEDKNGKLISLCRLTNRIVPIKSDK